MSGALVFGLWFLYENFFSKTKAQNPKTDFSEKNYL